MVVAVAAEVAAIGGISRDGLWSVSIVVQRGICPGIALNLAKAEGHNQKMVGDIIMTNHLSVIIAVRKVTWHANVINQSRIIAVIKVMEDYKVTLNVTIAENKGT